MLAGSDCSLQGHGMSFCVLAPAFSCLPFPKGLLGEKNLWPEQGKGSVSITSPLLALSSFLAVAY